MSVSLRHLLSPILRRWCTSSKSDDVTPADCDEHFECDEGVQMETRTVGGDAEGVGKDEGHSSDVENGNCFEPI